MNIGAAERRRFGWKIPRFTKVERPVTDGAGNPHQRDQTRAQTRELTGLDSRIRG
jgi:hypothetical protein